MIIIIVGGIGSGKTITAIKELVERSQHSNSYVNFETKGIKGVKRIQMDWVIKEEIVLSETDKPVKKKIVNWEFWDELRKKNERFSIFLDEVHNILHSRMSMSKNNILMSMWVAQIRKVFGDNENNHLYLITQKIDRIDVAVRDLAHYIIKCEKVMDGNDVHVIKSYYDSIEALRADLPLSKKHFKANPFFKYYDSYKFVTFGRTAYL